MFRYFSVIVEQEDLPVYPIGIFSHDRSLKQQPSAVRIDFPPASPVATY